MRRSIASRTHAAFGIVKRILLLPCQKYWRLRTAWNSPTHGIAFGQQTAFLLR